MKKTLLALLLLPLLSMAQTQTTNTMEFDGETREYISYVPASYDGSEAVPIVFCLHGLGDNMNNFTAIAMNLVADTANFIVITPQALIDPLTSSSAWNSGAGAFGLTLNADVDDVGFISSMIDSLSTEYNIDLGRVYSCGFSMGGFMSQRLACELNDRIAAIVSVAGTIGNGLDCNPGANVPVCHIHGTVDGTVAYEGNTFGSDAVETVEFWVDNNGCDPDSTHTNLPDLFDDGYTVEHVKYSPCDDGVDVELFTVNGADHDWLGPTNDIFYTTEIWKFFLKYQNVVGIEELENETSISIYPNPCSSFSTLEFNSSKNENVVIEIFDIKGCVVKTSQETVTTGNNSIELDVSELDGGIYSITIYSDSQSYSAKLAIAK